MEYDLCLASAVIPDHPMPAESNDDQKLDKVFVGGLAWTAGAKWLTQIVTWGSVFIAARLLTPADFGAVQMASFVTLLTVILAEFGIGSSVLQMRELDRRTLAQLNSVSLIFSSVAFLVSTAITPLVAGFFRTKALIPLMLVNNSAYFIIGFQAVPMGLVERDMDYRRLSIAESAQGIVQAVVTVGCALAGLGYWSLLFGPMAGKGTAAALYVFWKPLPFARPRMDEVLAPMKFGFQVAVSRLAWAAYTQSDAIIIGRVLGESALGAYQMAVNIASVPAEKIGLLIMRVTGPLFSKIQKDERLVKRYFFFISDGLALAIFPLAAGLVVVAPELVSVVLKPKWLSAVGPLHWLALYMAFRALSVLANQVLISLRFTRFAMWFSLFTAVVMPVTFFIAAPHGTSAVALAWLVMSPVILWPPAIKLFREAKIRAREYIAVLLPATIASAGMVFAVLALKRGVIQGRWPALPSLAAEVALGACVYAAILLVFYRPLVMRYIEFAKRMRSKDVGELIEVSGQNA